MGDLFSIHPGISRSRFSAGAAVADADSGEYGSELPDVIKAQITSHPRYPSLLDAYIDCRKVGAPPEVVRLLEGVRREWQPSADVCREWGTDPELDEFMEMYHEVLVKYKEEISRPLDEAVLFLGEIQSELHSICNGCSSNAAAALCSSSDELPVSSEEEPSTIDGEASEGPEFGPRMVDSQVKNLLLKKYSGYLTNLRKEFLKKRKKGKLPRDARSSLLDWWNSHYRWPYPTDEEKVQLAEMTGLDQKQINNWFINQRKRHWKPSENMRFSLMEGLSEMLYLDTGTIGP